jgi:precorrin-6A/cobalt-precorrin-6A reductase
MPDRLLILGGTSEAAMLAEQAVARFGPGLEVITSLAGRLPPPRGLAGRLRIGGFGGPSGIVRFLRDERIDLVIDATHPFAATISAAVADASAATGTPRLLFLRPPWTPQPGDCWHEVADFTAAAEKVGAIARRAFLTIGPSEIAAFSTVQRVFFLVRLFRLEPAPLPLADHGVIVARPPFTVEAEQVLLARERIDTLVSKQSGGPMEAKLTAARALGLAVVMIRRPEKPPGVRVDGVAGAMAWLEARLGWRAPTRP